MPQDPCNIFIFHCPFCPLPCSQRDTIGPGPKFFKLDLKLREGGDAVCQSDNQIVELDSGLPSSALFVGSRYESFELPKYCLQGLYLGENVSCSSYKGSQ